MSITINPTNLIAGSFKLIGVLGDGDNATDSMNQDAFSRLNELVDGLGVQRQTMLARVRTVYNLVANQATYTIGPGGDFNAARPVTVEGVGLLLNNTTPALEIALTQLTDDQYQAIGIKALTSTQPTEFYFNPIINASGQATIFLWPTPTINTNTLAVYVPVAVLHFVDLVTQVTLAPMYAKALRYALARELAPEFGRTLQPMVQQIYEESWNWLKAVNVHLSDLSIDPALASQGAAQYGYNILSDEGA